MKINQVAAQLYTVREHMKSPEDFTKTLAKVKKIGYQAVQLSAIPELPEKDVAAMLTDAGLVCCSTHESSERVLDEPAAIAERVKRYNGCTSTAYAYPSGVKLDTLEDVFALAKRLNESGRIMREHGVGLAYHNHNIEFRRYGRRTMLEVLYEETDPRNLLGEPDTYWIQYGGGDSVEWCERLKGRLPLLHMKDYKTTFENKPTFAEIGYGNLNWKRIVAAAEASGCEWYIVEQDRCDGDPFDSLKMSFEYIRDNLCS
ncbi:MAG: sugar phosphate isomerase/epimerase family protein [Armatimonadota bacterium]